MRDTPLDSRVVFERLDTQDMLGRIRDLPGQCRQAWAACQERLVLPDDYRDRRQIVVLGMGGSAIGGDLLAALLAQESDVSVITHRGYDLPPSVDSQTLVIAASYSGETEETLSAFTQALSTPAKKLAITTGGHLLALATENSVPAFQFQYASQPRAALGYSIVPLLAVAQAVGAVHGVEGAVSEAVSLMENLIQRIDAAVPTSANPAKQVALCLQGRLPVIYGAGFLTPVARRWKTQINENSKSWAFYEELPEANHNSIVGYGLPAEVSRLAYVVFLRSPALHPRVLLRYEATADALREASVESEVVEAEGESAFAQMMFLTLFGDYVSYYLALLNGVDPTPVAPIDTLKRRLAGRSP